LEGERNKKTDFDDVVFVELEEEDNEVGGDFNKSVLKV